MLRDLSRIYDAGKYGGGEGRIGSWIWSWANLGFHENKKYKIYPLENSIKLTCSIGTSSIKYIST